MSLLFWTPGPDFGSSSAISRPCVAKRTVHRGGVCVLVFGVGKNVGHPSSLRRDYHDGVVNIQNFLPILDQMMFGQTSKVMILSAVISTTTTTTTCCWWPAMLGSKHGFCCRAWQGLFGEDIYCDCPILVWSLTATYAQEFAHETKCESLSKWNSICQKNFQFCSNDCLYNLS